jgi:hypothetical protein
MTNKVYDVLKFIAQIVLPALGTLYFALSSIWGLPYGEEIVGTITAIDAFLGALLGISSAQFYKDGRDVAGTLSIDVDNDTADFNFSDISTEDLATQKVVKVNVESYAGKHEG